MAALTTDFPSMIDLCPGPDLLFWASNLKAIYVQRLIKPWQRDISLTSNPFKPNEILIHTKPHPITKRQTLYPQHEPASMSRPTAASLTGPNDKHAELDNAIRMILTFHGTFKHDYAYIVKFFHETGHKDVDLAFVRQVWRMYKDSADCGDGWVRGLKVRWPVEMRHVDAKADWGRANVAKQQGEMTAVVNTEKEGN
ncbi:hypothetical protein MMC26_003434 [Xylographa opegraphella]|nr:hypothetical protein [Xylographa opegraphella]